MFKCYRIRTEKNGGAWCPKQQIGKDVYEWLEIDFGDLHVVSMVETQGRFGNGQVIENIEHSLSIPRNNIYYIVFSAFLSNTILHILQFLLNLLNLVLAIVNTLSFCSCF